MKKPENKKDTIIKSTLSKTADIGANLVLSFVREEMQLMSWQNWVLNKLKDM